MRDKQFLYRLIEETEKLYMQKRRKAFLRMALGYGVGLWILLYWFNVFNDFVGAIIGYLFCTFISGVFILFAFPQKFKKSYEEIRAIERYKKEIQEIEKRSDDEW